jgi:transcriptional regulator with XRE-family HTH domain
MHSMIRATPISPSTTYRAIVGKLLSVRRSERKLDQEALGRAVGVNQSTWSRIETGTSAMSLDQLRRACHALGLTPGALLTHADAAAAHIARRGVEILTEPGDSDESDKAVAFLGGAALAALVLAVIAKK